MLAATSGARRSYLIAVVSAFTLAMVAAWAPWPEAFGVFLVVAPLGPLVATASAFGRWADPAQELLVTVPSSVRLLLVRTAASVAPALAFTALSSLWLVERGWLAVAWLAPSLALSAATLALARWVAVEVAATGLGLAWSAAPVVLRLQVHDLVGWLGGPGQLLSAGAAVVAAAVFVLDRRSLDRSGA
jgi:hypothetical protein